MKKFLSKFKQKPPTNTNFWETEEFSNFILQQQQVEIQANETRDAALNFFEKTKKQIQSINI